MNTQLIRLTCTAILCLSCVSIYIFQILRKNIADQELQTLALQNWQNQQINQYIAHRVLLAPHKEPLGLSQWKSSENNKISFCKTIQKSMNLPNQWVPISSLDSEWQTRLNLNNWLSSLEDDSVIIKLIQASYLKFTELPSLSSSLCSLQLSTKVGESNTLSTVIKFSSKNNVYIKK